MFKQMLGLFEQAFRMLLYACTVFDGNKIPRHKMQTTGSKKDGAEKKLFLGTELQEVSCYSLANEKGTSNLSYANLHDINRTVVGPEMIQVHEIAYNFLQIIRSVLDSNFPAFVKRFTRLCRCFAILATCNDKYNYSSDYFRARYIGRHDTV